MAGTATNQDFEIFAGDVGVIQFLVTDQPNGGGNPIDLGACSDIIFLAARNFDDETAAVLTKKLSTQGITLLSGGTAGRCALNLETADTNTLTLAYAYTLQILDDLGNPTTVATGQMKVKPKPTASYSGDPAQSKRDYVRALVGDDDVDKYIFNDQVYDNLFTNFGGALYVAAQVCRMLAVRYSRQATKRVGDLSISKSDIARSYKAMAAEYQAQADLGGTLYCAGISKSDMKSYRRLENPDAVGCFTTIHAFDNRGGAYGGFIPTNAGGDP